MTTATPSEHARQIQLRERIVILFDSRDWSPMEASRLTGIQYPNLIRKLAGSQWITLRDLIMVSDAADVQLEYMLQRLTTFERDRLEQITGLPTGAHTVGR